MTPYLRSRVAINSAASRSDDTCQWLSSSSGLDGMRNLSLYDDTCPYGSSISVSTASISEASSLFSSKSLHRRSTGNTTSDSCESLVKPYASSDASSRNTPSVRDRMLDERCELGVLPPHLDCLKIKPLDSKAATLRMDPGRAFVCHLHRYLSSTMIDRYPNPGAMQEFVRATKLEKREAELLLQWIRQRMKQHCQDSGPVRECGSRRDLTTPKTFIEEVVSLLQGKAAQLQINSDPRTTSVGPSPTKSQRSKNMRARGRSESNFSVNAILQTISHPMALAVPEGPIQGSVNRPSNALSTFAPISSRSDHKSDHPASVWFANPPFPASAPTTSPCGHDKFTPENIMTFIDVWIQAFVMKHRKTLKLALLSSSISILQSTESVVIERMLIQHLFKDKHMSATEADSDFHSLSTSYLVGLEGQYVGGPHTCDTDSKRPVVTEQTEKGETTTHDLEINWSDDDTSDTTDATDCIPQIELRFEELDIFVDWTREKIFPGLVREFNRENLLSEESSYSIITPGTDYSSQASSTVRAHASGQGNQGNTPNDISNGNSFLSPGLGRPKKRKRRESDEADRPKKGSQLPEQAPDTAIIPSESKKYFACHFHKRDPERFCSGQFKSCPNGFVGINRLKDHLRRVHTPTHFCARCKQIFRTLDLKSAHENSEPRCPPRESTSFECFITTTRSTKALVKKSQSISNEEEWYKMWKDIFPDHNQPSSAYKEVEMRIGAFRDYAYEQAPFVADAFRNEYPDSSATFEILYEFFFFAIGHVTGGFEAQLKTPSAYPYNESLVAESIQMSILLGTGTAQSEARQEAIHNVEDNFEVRQFSRHADDASASTRQIPRHTGPSVYHDNLQTNDNADSWQSIRHPAITFQNDEPCGSEEEFDPGDPLSEDTNPQYGL